MSITITNKSKSFLSIDPNSLLAALQDVFDRRGEAITIKSNSRTSFSQAAERVGGGERLMHAIRIETPTHAGTDVVKPYVVVRDRTYPGAAADIRIGLYRLVCTNGLMIGTDTSSFKIPHLPNRRDMLSNLDMLIDQAYEHLNQVLVRAEALQGMEIQNPQFLVAQLEHVPERVRAAVCEAILYGRHRSVDNPNTAWGLYNIVNEFDRLMSRKGSIASLERDHKTVNLIENYAKAA
jgi:hypothetical protein